MTQEQKDVLFEQARNVKFYLGHREARLYGRCMDFPVLRTDPRLPETQPEVAVSWDLVRRAIERGHMAVL